MNLEEKLAQRRARRQVFRIGGDRLLEFCDRLVEVAEHVGERGDGAHG